MKTGLKDRRLGIFRIPLDMINEHPDYCREVLSGCIVLRAEMRWDLDAIEYFAINDAFETVPLECIAREYRVLGQKTDAGVHLTGWQRAA